MMFAKIELYMLDFSSANIFLRTEKAIGFQNHFRFTLAVTRRKRISASVKR